MEADPELNLAEVLEWLWEAQPPAHVERKARELALDTLGCVLAAGAKPQLQQLAARFAAVRHVHYGAAAALALRPRLAHRLADISRIQLRIYAEALTYCANRAPERPLQAQFSLSYGLARALVSGDLSPDAYSDSALRDPLVRALEAKVELIENAEPRRAGRLTLELEGERLEHAVDDLPAMTRDEVVEKFVAYTRRPRAVAARLLDAPVDASFEEVFIRI